MPNFSGAITSISFITQELIEIPSRVPRRFRGRYYYNIFYLLIIILLGAINICDDIMCRLLDISNRERYYEANSRTGTK